MSGIIIQICRTKTEDELQHVIGGAIRYWNKFGYTKVSVDFDAGTGGHAGIYTMTQNDAKPQKLAMDNDTEQTAVLVLSTP